MQAPLFEDAARPLQSGIVVRIALPVPIDSLFDYAVPKEMAEHARPGHRALVPFSGRRLTGVIVERAADTRRKGDRELARIDRLIDSEPVVSEAMIGLLRQAARDLLCPVGLALGHALPPGSSPRMAHQLEITERGRRALDGGFASEAARAVLAALREAPLTSATLARRLGSRPGSGTRPGVPSPSMRELTQLTQLTQEGLIVKVPVEMGPRVRETRHRVVAVAPGVDVRKACAGPLARAPKQAELLRRLAGAGQVPTR